MMISDWCQNDWRVCEAGMWGLGDGQYYLNSLLGLFFGRLNLLRCQFYHKSILRYILNNHKSAFVTKSWASSTIFIYIFHEFLTTIMTILISMTLHFPVTKFAWDRRTTIRDHPFKMTEVWIYCSIITCLWNKLIVFNILCCNKIIITRSIDWWCYLVSFGVNQALLEWDQLVKGTLVEGE